MSTYYTIRPTPAQYVRIGDRIRIEGTEVTVRQIFGTKATCQPYGMRLNRPGERLYCVVPNSCPPFTCQGTHVLDVVVGGPRSEA